MKLISAKTVTHCRFVVQRRMYTHTLRTNPVRTQHTYRSRTRGPTARVVSEGYLGASNEAKSLACHEQWSMQAFNMFSLGFQGEEGP